MSFEYVPDELLEARRWLVNDDKVPKAPWVGKDEAVDASSPFAQTGFETAREWQRMVPGYGLSFYVRLTDPWFFIDLDGVVDSDGVLDPDAEEIVDRFESYTEVSPSGTGLHIVARGELPVGARFKGVEVYEERTMTVTGNIWRNGVEHISDASDSDVEWLVDEYGYTATPRSYSGEYSGGEPLYDTPITELFDLPEEVNVPHPIHGSTTGGNFRVREGGDFGTCWRHSSDGEGCVLNSGHLLAMEALDITDCDQVRDEWGPDVALSAYVHGVEERDLPPEDPPVSVLLEAAAPYTPWDTEDMDAKTFAKTCKIGRRALRKDYGIDPGEYAPDVL
jgi:hypothetical protein